MTPHEEDLLRLALDYVIASVHNLDTKPEELLLIMTEIHQKTEEDYKFTMGVISGILCFLFSASNISQYSEAELREFLENRIIQMKDEDRKFGLA